MNNPSVRIVPVKWAMHSKTVLTSIIVMLVSLAGILVEVWAAASPEQKALVDELFGPQATLVVGVAMLFLRELTKSPLRWRR